MKSIKNDVKRIRVKICGITRPEDGTSAALAGADAIGLVFYTPSKRSVTIEQANTIIDGLPPFITKVGLFVDASSEYIRSVINSVNLDLLQFRGEEDQDACLLYSKPFVKAVKMEKRQNTLSLLE